MTSTSRRASAETVAARLSDPQARLGAARSALSLPETPGLYAWWATKAGAQALSLGLGIHLRPGLIYAGQAGATRWPSGKPSPATLASRIRSGHLGSSIDGSTFRLTLAALLQAELGLQMRDEKYLTSEGERNLTTWMEEHLAVTFVPVEDSNSLRRLEESVLGLIDPPLNLEGMRPTPIRQTLSHARRRLLKSHGGSASSVRRIGLVGCVKTKGTQIAEAKDLYRSPLFIGRRQVVESTCDRWFVLSAKHGLLEPGRRIAPYDVTLTTASAVVRRRWSEKVIRQLELALGDFAGLAIDIHAGAAYANWGLADGLRERGARVRVPTSGLSLGAQLAFYRRQVGRQKAPR